MRADFGGPVDHRPPDFLTVVEAGAVLRFSRGKAYELAREFLATGGASGMPAIRLGRQLRVPRALLEQRIGGPITWPFPMTQPTETVAIASPVASKPSRSHATRPPVRRYDDQSVRGFDVTASVPKSVSVLFALGDRDVRREVVAAPDAMVAVRFVAAGVDV